MISAGKVSDTTIDRSRTTNGCRGSGRVASLGGRLRAREQIEVQLGHEHAILARQPARIGDGRRHLAGETDDRTLVPDRRRHESTPTGRATRNGSRSGFEAHRHARARRTAARRCPSRRRSRPRGRRRTSARRRRRRSTRPRRRASRRRARSACRSRTAARRAGHGGGCARRRRRGRAGATAGACRTCRTAGSRRERSNARRGPLSVAALCAPASRDANSSAAFASMKPNVTASDSRRPSAPAAPADRAGCADRAAAPAASSTGKVAASLSKP